MPCGARKVGRGRSTGMLRIVSRAILKSTRLAPATARPRGTPAASVNMLRFTPFFLVWQSSLAPRAVGVRVAASPNRLPHAPTYQPTSADKDPHAPDIDHAVPGVRAPYA